MVCWAASAELPGSIGDGVRFWQCGPMNGSLRRTAAIAVGVVGAVALPAANAVLATSPPAEATGSDLAIGVSPRTILMLDSSATVTPLLLNNGPSPVTGPTTVLVTLDPELQFISARVPRMGSVGDGRYRV